VWGKLNAESLLSIDSEALVPIQHRYNRMSRMTDNKNATDF